MRNSRGALIVDRGVPIPVVGLSCRSCQTRCSLGRTSASSRTPALVSETKKEGGRSRRQETELNPRVHQSPSLAHFDTVAGDFSPPRTRA